MRDQEEARRREEADRKRQLQEQYAKEQKDLAAKLHKTHLDRLEMETQKVGEQNSKEISLKIISKMPSFSAVPAGQIAEL